MPLTIRHGVWNVHIVATGGGGGGLSLVPSGGIVGVSSPDSVPSVVVTLELPRRVVGALADDRATICM
ncbi:hypothetical protein ACFTZB_43615 [Rhodococcus sp. NPDC057014]|uniref:hypothetical protein n=1 Tax=Rhodococcus sp. NPDC057014 TaxID=3346000 RepID=UPI00364484BB